LDVTLWGRSNTCTFTHERRRIKLLPNHPKTWQVEKKSVTPKKEKGLNLINLKEIKKEVADRSPLVILVAREDTKDFLEPILPAVSLVITEFSDVFPKDLADQLPPMRNVQHIIYLVPRATLPSLPQYWMNPMEHAELKGQVDELLRRGFIRENLSPCAVLALLTPRKDES